MSSTVIDRAQISKLIDELNENQQLPSKLAPFLDDGWVLEEDDHVSVYHKSDRRPITKPFPFEIAEVLKGDRNRLNREVDTEATKLCLKVLLADVELPDGSLRSTAADEVETVLAVNGITVQTFEKIQPYLFDGENQILVGFSKGERDSLANLMPALEVQMVNGKVDYICGMKIEEFPKDYFQEDHGQRSCFALAKGGLHLEIKWTADFENNQVVANIRAVRVDGKRVVKVLTTV